MQPVCGGEWQKAQVARVASNLALQAPQVSWALRPARWSHTPGTVVLVGVQQAAHGQKKVKGLLPGRTREAAPIVVRAPSQLFPCLQEESTHEGGAAKLIFLTRSVAGLASAQQRMVSLEVCRRRRTLCCASWYSSGCHHTLASKAEKVLATARCRKARHLLVGLPPKCGRSASLGEISQREAAMKL